MSVVINSLFPKEYGYRKGQKQGGIHTPDPDGGIFTNITDTFLIKRDRQEPHNDIAEYLASCLFEKLSPGVGATVELVKSKKGDTFLGPVLGNKRLSATLNKYG